MIKLFILLLSFSLFAAKTPCKNLLKKSIDSENTKKTRAYNKKSPHFDEGASVTGNAKLNDNFSRNSSEYTPRGDSWDAPVRGGSSEQPSQKRVKRKSSSENVSSGNSHFDDKAGSSRNSYSSGSSSWDYNGSASNFGDF